MTGPGDVCGRCFRPKMLGLGGGVMACTCEDVDWRARAEKAEAALELVRSAEKLEMERLAAWNQIEATADIVDPGHLLRVNEELRKRLALLRNQVPGLTASLDEYRHRAEAAEKRAAALEELALILSASVPECVLSRLPVRLAALLGGGS